jgi:hypothetical protein
MPHKVILIPEFQIPRFLFNLYVNTSGQIQPHQGINRLRAGFHYIDKALVSTNLKLLLRILIDKRRPNDREFFDLGRQGHRTYYDRSCTFGCINDLPYRLIQHAVVVSFQTDAYLLLSHTFPLQPQIDRLVSRRQIHRQPFADASHHPTR